MLRHKGGELVKGGFYWCRGTWRLEVVSGRNGMLPGHDDATYFRVPLLLIVPTALVLSVAFVIFLPFIGFAVLAEGVYAHARAALRRDASSGSLSEEKAVR